MTKKYMLLYGKKSIAERLKMDPQSIRKIIIADTFQDKQIIDLAAEKNILIEKAPEKKVLDLKRKKNVQGIVARVEHFEYADYGLILNEKEQDCLVFLDRVNDPQNLGVILRSLACFGGFAVIIPEKESTKVTEAVMHVAQGGENYIPVSQVSDLKQAILKAKEVGFEIIGSLVSEQAGSLEKTKLSFPLAVVLGAEATGISPEIQEIVGQNVFIPMPGAKLSFNVAMAATVLAYEINRQRSRSIVHGL